MSIPYQSLRNRTVDAIHGHVVAVISRPAQCQLRQVTGTDNFYAALNSAVFSDGSFVYVPKGVRCPMELSTYFRINAGNTGQFERTLLVADEGAYLSYLEGCTAPMRDEHCSGSYRGSPRRN